MSALDTKALRALAADVVVSVGAVADAAGWAAHDAAVVRRAHARDAFADALSPDVVLALLDRLERAERITPSVEAGELVELVLTTCRANKGVSDDEASHAAAFVQRALDAAEERGAEAEREQRDIERRHGPEACR